MNIVSFGSREIQDQAYRLTEWIELLQYARCHCDSGGHVILSNYYVVTGNGAVDKKRIEYYRFVTT